MPNLTITIDEELLRWVRLRAAEHDISVDRFLGDLLRDHMLGTTGYEAARQRFLATRPRALSEGLYPSRDEMHDRR